ncbi:hypothetical protein Tco_0163596 [Tanacetum coccineum]
MIQPERRDLPRDNPLVSVEVLRYDKKRSKSENKGIVPTEMELVLEQTQQEHPSDTKVFTMKMEILLEPTSNKLYGRYRIIKKTKLKQKRTKPSTGMEKGRKTKAEGPRWQSHTISLAEKCGTQSNGYDLIIDGGYDWRAKIKDWERPGRLEGSSLSYK